MLSVFPRVFGVVLACLCVTPADAEAERDAAKVIRAAGGKLSHSKDGTAVVGVDFRGAAVGERPLDVLKRLPGLETLDLTGARISGDSLRHVARLDRLESLTLIGTRVGDDGMRHLAGLTRLRHLDLTGTEVGDAGLAHLAALTTLQTLLLGGTLVTDAGMPHLRALKNLEVLDLYATGITYDGVLQLDGLRQLRELDLCGDAQYAYPGEGREEAFCELACRKAFPNIERVIFGFTPINFRGLANCPKLQAMYNHSPEFLHTSFEGMTDAEVQAITRRQRMSYFQFLGSFKQLRLLVAPVLPESDDEWAALGGMKKLESLSLAPGWSIEPLTERELAHIAQWKGLKHLGLGGMGVKGQTLKCLAPLENLRSLELSSDELTAKDLAKLPEFEHLETLCLGMDLGRRGLSVLPRLDSLVTLDLSGCTFPSGELRYLQKFPKLQELNLNGAMESLDGEAVLHLRRLKSLRSLDVRGMAVTEENIGALRRDMPGLERVLYDAEQPWPPPEPAPPFARWRRADVFERILVQALVARCTNGSGTSETRGFITQVYVGPRRLAGQSFLACYPLGRPSMSQTLFSGSGRLPTHELVLTHLDRHPDGTLRMRCLEGSLHFRFSWPGWLVQPTIGYLGSPKPDYHRQQEVAEFLRAAFEKPESERIVFLRKQVVAGSDLEASIAVQLLMMDPIDPDAESHLFQLLDDESLPLLRRIIIDEEVVLRPNPWYGHDHPWNQSPERLALLEKWARGLKSPEETRRLAADLAAFGGYSPIKPWVGLPEPKKGALALIGAVQAIQENPMASVKAKRGAVSALGALSQGVGRDEAFQLLLRLAKDPSGDEVRGRVISELAGFAPFNPKEAAQVRQLLELTIDESSRQEIESSLAKPQTP